MKKQMKVVTVLAAFAAGMLVSDVCAEEAQKAADAVPSDPVPAEPATPEKPKKKPKKLPVYMQWDKAMEVAEAYEQPIIAFIDLQGDKTSGKIKRDIFGKQEIMKDFVLPNAVYYTYTVKAEKAPPGHKRDKDAAPKADMKSIKESERIAVTRIATGGDKPAWGEAPAVLPAVAVVAPVGGPSGKLIGLVRYDTEGAALGGMITGIKDLMEKEKYSAEIGKKVQKLIDAEAKKIAELEKRQRK